MVGAGGAIAFNPVVRCEMFARTQARHHFGTAGIALAHHAAVAAEPEALSTASFSLWLPGTTSLKSPARRKTGD